MSGWGRILLLSIGGILGVNARYVVALWMKEWTNPLFPWPTFAINVSGSFLVGFLACVLARWLPHENARVMMVTGFLGGYTTFSTFAFESYSLWEQGARVRSLVYGCGSLVAGFFAVLLGICLAGAIGAPMPRPPSHPAPSSSSHSESTSPVTEDRRE
jgi:fluoride exporter